MVVSRVASVCFYLDTRELSLLYGDVGFYLRRECSVNAAGYVSGGRVLKDGAACLALGRKWASFLPLFQQYRDEFFSCRGQ